MPYKCFAFDQLFVSLDGTIRSCCMARRHFRMPGKAIPGNILELKIENNRQIAQGDRSGCWPECEQAHETPDHPGLVASKIAVYTNTFCPLRCCYCSQTYPDFQHQSREPGSNRPLVAQSGNNIGHLANILRAILDSPRGRSIKAVELSGGDSAFHPEFVQLLDLLCGRGVNAIYLSSGIVPKVIIPNILEKVEEGSLEVSVSTDAATAETWSGIKRSPKVEFKRVCEFIERISRTNQSQMHVKFIVMQENAHEAGHFIGFYHGLGVVNFCVSEMREEQALHRVEAPCLEIASKACIDILRSFNEIRMEDGASPLRLSVVGLDQFFGNRNSFMRNSL